MSDQAPNARVLIEHIAKALVDEKDAVFVDEYEDGDETVIELEVAEQEVGKVIGRSGRIARALRTVGVPIIYTTIALFFVSTRTKTYCRRRGSLIAPVKLSTACSRMPAISPRSFGRLTVSRCSATARS